MTTRRRIAALTVALAALVPVATSATTPAAKCAATKIRATGKFAAARLACQGKAIKRGAPFDQPCEQKVTDKWVLTFEKAEARGGCLTIGDGGTISGKVDAFFSDVVNELDQNETAATRPCIGDKVVAAGRKARDKLNCNAKAVQKGAAVDPACLTKAENRFSTTFSSAESGGMCGTTGDAGTIEGKVDAFVDDVVAEEPGEATTTTTSTTSTSTTTTTIPLASCCPAERFQTVSGPGTLQVSTLPAFALPAGIQMTLDADTADGAPTCKHPVTVPAGGFNVPVFCNPTLGFTNSITATGCASGGTDGSGSVWDAGASCPDADVSKVGDTSDGVCNPSGQMCTTSGAGNNTLGDIDTSRGDGMCDAPGLQAQVDVPIHVREWVPADASCPDTDGQFDPGTDTLINEFDVILSPTTATAQAAFADKNADGCKRAGNGPDATKVCSANPSQPCLGGGPPCSGTCVQGALVGSPASGQCCGVGQTLTFVATGIAFTGSPPLYDLIFAASIPTSVTACGTPPGSASCTLTNDPCQD